ncbi:iron ABC transporter permease [Siccirubricoccus sp. KC 17139]|uniref:Iron ABC transporter permease n=1 Tax=Siccirubricoccus soli TaxID=2899147 RepID=A0ABT1D0S2_9PROT|nr:iron ABC transporter permease [Siccirubricoccus soli]MCO6414854.1 iron ABC transporter permease [Siccirubricoccus soli]MCP2680984.1 iron ABC transporter permease [Siccirubricoccus soli]
MPDTAASLPEPVGEARGTDRLGLLGRLRHVEPVALVWLLLIVALLFLVVAPLAKLFAVSFETQGTGEFTLSNYVTAYGRARYVDALVNSLTLGLASAALSVALAVPMAWAVSRTDMPGKGLTWGVVMGAFVMPPYLGAVGWMLLAGPNSGAANRFWRWATGAEGPLFNIFSFEGLALVIALHSFPLVFIFVKAALDLISSEMEDAANILGAGTWTAMRKVSLPLVWPAILGAFVVVFLETIALFGTPALIGIPARINVVTTQLWQFFEYPVRVEVAAAYAMPLLLITVGMIVAQKLLLARKGFVSQTGKGGERRPIKLGPWRWLLFAWCALVGLLSVVMPLGILVQASFAKAWGRGISLDNFTLRNYQHLIFEHEMALTSIWNTIWFSASAATMAVLIALLVAYIVQRRLVPFGDALGFLAMAPFVIPGIVMAIGFYAAYASPPLALYGTAAIIIFAFTARFLPIAYANSAAAVRTVHPEMEEAARILGSGRLHAIVHVTAPLLKKALLGGWLIVFIVATRELSAAIFLVGPRTRTMSVLLYDLSEAGNFEVLAAFGGLLLLITLVLVGIGMKLVGRDFMLRRN